MLSGCEPCKAFVWDSGLSAYKHIQYLVMKSYREWYRIQRLICSTSADTRQLMTFTAYKHDTKVCDVLLLHVTQQSHYRAMEG